MELMAASFYCLRDDLRSTTGTAEAMAAAFFFGGSEKRREFLERNLHAPEMTSKNPLIRRLRGIPA